MPAKDIYHDTVKNALIKDGWAITAENMRLPWGGTQTYVDIFAEEIFVAEKEGRKIAVEVKSFIGKSTLSEFEKAVGQFIIYRFAMRRIDPERELFLAVKQETFNEFFVNADVLELIESEDLKIIVFDEVKEVIVRWIN
ncbi:MAG TPA: element excision factor XisH family protein [Pyrinomonadaceae bacterium]|nr:element excision factor XisH family protein [Pyrinomonadaceae bacterium]